MPTFRDVIEESVKPTKVLHVAFAVELREESGGVARLPGRALGTFACDLRLQPGSVSDLDEFHPKVNVPYELARMLNTEIGAKLAEVVEAALGGPRCATCGKRGHRPMNHAGWHPDDDKAG